MTVRPMQGPTIAPIFSPDDAGLAEGHAWYAATICVPKSRLYASVKELRKVSWKACRHCWMAPSADLVSSLTFACAAWRQWRAGAPHDLHI